MENVASQYLFLPLTGAIKSSQFSDEAQMYVCQRCKKTFFNSIALKNHINFQHFGDSSVSENRMTYPVGQSLIGDFVFIPNELNNQSTDTIYDDLTTRTFGEDTTYLFFLVINDDNVDTPANTGDTATKPTQLKPPVNLKGPFTCTYPATLPHEMQCLRMFFNCCDYSLHYRDEHTKRRKAVVRCQVCEKRLDGYSSEVATQPQPVNRITFFCRMCGLTFLKSSEYDEHNRLVHVKMKPHQCPLCSKRFTQQGGLQQHMRMHSGIRPFACTFCPKAFTQKAGLDQHLRTHTKVKPFKCVICTKSFSQSVHLRQHMRTHTNIQPFGCTVCGRRFKQSSHLNFHMRSHVLAGTLPMESYAQVIREQNHLQFLTLANLQPVQDGETLYYAAELAPNTSIADIDADAEHPQIVVPESMLSL